MKHYLSLLLPVLIFSSCNTHRNAHPIQLTENSFYDIDSVRAAMGGGSEQAGQKKLAQAMDIYINVRDAGKSIDIFKSAIHLQPSAKAYFGLGSALLDDGRYEEAQSALHIAEKLNYSPLANVMYKLALASASMNTDREWRRDSLSLHYMEIALQMGYAHPDEFLNAGGFKGLKNSYSFTSIYNNALAGGAGHGNPQKLLWETFLSEFHPVELPLTINIEWIRTHQPDNPIAYDYEKFIPEMRNAKFSREVEKEYYYCGLIKKDTAYTALIYAGKNNFITDADQRSPVFYLLTTYDRNGKIIDKMQVAGQSNFTENFKVLTFQPNYTFIVSDFKNIYKDDPVEKGYDSNSVVRSEPQGTAAYRITANGKLEKTDAPLALR